MSVNRTIGPLVYILLVTCTITKNFYLVMDEREVFKYVSPITVFNSAILHRFFNIFALLRLKSDIFCFDSCLSMFKLHIKQSLMINKLHFGKTMI